MDCLEYLGGKEYFSTLDLRESFLQIRVQSDSVSYMPYGLRNASSAFQRFITKLLRPLVDTGRIVVYKDDIVIATGTIGEHVGILREVLLLLK